MAAVPPLRHRGNELIESPRPIPRHATFPFVQSMANMNHDGDTGSEDEGGGRPMTPDGFRDANTHGPDNRGDQYRLSRGPGRRQDIDSSPPGNGYQLAPYQYPSYPAPQAPNYSLKNGVRFERPLDYNGHYGRPSPLSIPPHHQQTQPRRPSYHNRFPSAPIFRSNSQRRNTYNEEGSPPQQQQRSITGGRSSGEYDRDGIFVDSAIDENTGSGSGSGGGLQVSQHFDADPYANLDGIIQRAGGVVQSLTLSIPSLQQLVDRYRGVSEQLDNYGHVVAEQEEVIHALRQREKQLEALKKNLDQMSGMHTAEGNTLRNRIGGLEFEVKRMKDEVAGKDRERREFEGEVERQKEQMQREFEQWKNDASEVYDVTIKEKDEMFRKMVEEKDAFYDRAMKEKRGGRNEELEEREASHRALMKLMEEAHRKECEDIRSSLEGRIKDLESVHTAKMESLHRELEEAVGKLDKHAEEVRELQALFDSERQTLQDGFALRKKSMETEFAVERARLVETHLHDKVELEERFHSERQTLITTHAKEKAELEEIYAKEFVAMEENYSTEKRTTELAFLREKAQLKTLFDEEKGSLEAAFEEQRLDLQNHFDAAKKSWDEERAKIEGENEMLSVQKSELERAKQTLEASLVNLEGIKNVLEADKLGLLKERETKDVAHLDQIGRLEAIQKGMEITLESVRKENIKLLETLKKVADEEEGGEICSRGDGFYIDAFSQLKKDIVDISHEFSQLPIAPPSKVVAELPQGLPPMFGNSDASRLVRQAYVQHIISKHLCYRIFQPFLFSLGKRYDKADMFFQSMSNQLREKSTRKEAVWRHYTLLAGYTASSGKKNAQVAAKGVIEEIIAYIKPFAPDGQRMDVIISGITRIVKFAVETWRYARMERELITAHMRLEETSADVWDGHRYEKDHPYASDIGLYASIKALGTDHEMIIPLLPVFRREGTLPSLYRPTAMLDDGKVFAKGIALYTDCLPILHRKSELNLIKGPSPIYDPESLLAAKAEIRAKERAEAEESVKRAREREEADRRSRKEAQLRKQEEDELRKAGEEAELRLKQEAERQAVEDAERAARKKAAAREAAENERQTKERWEKLMTEKEELRMAREREEEDRKAMEERLALEREQAARLVEEAKRIEEAKAAEEKKRAQAEKEARRAAEQAARLREEERRIEEAKAEDQRRQLEWELKVAEEVRAKEEEKKRLEAEKQAEKKKRAKLRIVEKARKLAEEQARMERERKLEDERRLEEARLAELKREEEAAEAERLVEEETARIEEEERIRYREEEEEAARFAEEEERRFQEEEEEVERIREAEDEARIELEEIERKWQEDMAETARLAKEYEERKRLAEEKERREEEEERIRATEEKKRRDEEAERKRLEEDAKVLEQSTVYEDHKSEEEEAEEDYAEDDEFAEEERVKEERVAEWIQREELGAVGHEDDARSEPDTHIGKLKDAADSVVGAERGLQDNKSKLDIVEEGETAEQGHEEDSAVGKANSSHGSEDASVRRHEDLTEYHIPKITVQKEGMDPETVAPSSRSDNTSSATGLVDHVEHVENVEPETRQEPKIEEREISQEELDQEGNSEDETPAHGENEHDHDRQSDAGTPVAAEHEPSKSSENTLHNMNLVGSPETLQDVENSKGIDIHSNLTSKDEPETPTTDAFSRSSESVGTAVPLSEEIDDREFQSESNFDQSQLGTSEVGDSTRWESQLGSQRDSDVGDEAEEPVLQDYGSESIVAGFEHHLDAGIVEDAEHTSSTVESDETARTVSDATTNEASAKRNEQSGTSGTGTEEGGEEQADIAPSETTADDSVPPTPTMEDTPNADDNDAAGIGKKKKKNKKGKSGKKA